MKIQLPSNDNLQLIELVVTLLKQKIKKKLVKETLTL